MRRTRTAVPVDLPQVTLLLYMSCAIVFFIIEKIGNFVRRERGHIGWIEVWRLLSQSVERERHGGEKNEVDFIFSFFHF